MTDQITIKAGDVVRDIRSGMSDWQLMEKYEISATGIQQLFKQLLEAKAVRPSELQGRNPLYKDSVTLDDLRSSARDYVDHPLAIHEYDRPDNNGIICDVSDNGLRIKGVSVRIGEVKTFVIPADELFVISPIVLEATCNWVRREGRGENLYSGFNIGQVSSGNWGDLRTFVQSHMNMADSCRLYDDDEGTESVDLSRLMVDELTSSGSFSFTGITKTWFGRLVQVLPVPALLIDESGKITFANQCWERFSSAHREILNKPFASLFPNPWVAQEAQSIAEKVFSTRRPEIYQAVLQIEENKIWGRMHFRSIRVGVTRSLLILIEDLTLERAQLAQKQKHEEAMQHEIEERKRTEEALQIKESVVASSINGIAIADLSGVLTYVNAAVLKLWGYDHEGELLGKKTLEFWSEEEQAKQAWQATVNVGSWTGELVAKKKDGSPFHVQTATALVKDDTGKTMAVMGSFSDLTERKALEKQFLQAQKMEAVGTLAGGIAHEFNNLLQVTMGFSELLLLQKKETEQEYADLQKINQAARAGRDLVHRLLTFSRKTESNQRPINLNQQIRHVQEIVSRTIPRMIKIDAKLADPLAPINADPGQIEQLIMNLAVNARDAMPEGGKLTIRTECVTLDDAYCRTHSNAKPGLYVLLSISDTGTGMDKKTLEHIFDPFFTTKEVGRGTGLGLSVVYGIVQQHGGHIKCESEQGTGTTFQIYFPAIEDHEDSSGKSAPTADIPGGTETVLLVDDEDFVRELGEQVLGRCGYKVLAAKTGKEALEIYRKEERNIALVILDLIMPEMSGRQCIRKLLKLNPALKILVASGYASDGTPREALDLGAKGFVSKPFNVAQLLQQVRQVLDAP